MELLPDQLAFVKGQAEFHRRQMAKWSHDSRRQTRHAETAEHFEKLAKYIEELEWKVVLGPSPKPSKTSGVAVTWEEAQELPEELLAELSISETDKAEFQVLSIIDAQGGTASLDRILVEYYRATGEIMKRQTMTNRLYRMATKDLIWSVAGKKGIYTTQKLGAVPATPAFDL